MGRPGETPVAGRVRQEEGRGAREDEHRARYRGGDSPRSRPGRPRTAAHGQLHYGPAAKASGSGARGQIAFGPDIAQGPAIISLLENADLSTFIHESGQFFLGVRSHTAGKSSFSVATANSPWRSAPHHGQLGALRRFNEATANSPWRSTLSKCLLQGRFLRLVRALRIWRAPSDHQTNATRRGEGKNTTCQRAYDFASAPVGLHRYQSAREGAAVTAGSPPVPQTTTASRTTGSNVLPRLVTRGRIDSAGPASIVMM